MNLLKLFLGTRNERELKKLWPIVHKINEIEAGYQTRNLADEDFPASGRLFLDRSAGHYLTIEDIVTVGEILLRRLEEQLLQ